MGKAMQTAPAKSRPCPRCGETDLDEPCRGDPAFGSKPLRYRHAGRDPPADQMRLGVNKDG
jgi:hypothetical protein